MLTFHKPEKNGDLGQFIPELKGETGDAGAFEGVIRSMAGTSKKAPATSLPDCSGD